VSNNRRVLFNKVNSLKIINGYLNYIKIFSDRNTSPPRDK